MIALVKSFYFAVFYQPLLNALVFLYERASFGDLGIAIIILTILIRLILFPIFKKSIRQQMVMQRIQPQLKKIQETHKNDPRKQWEEMRNLHRAHAVNPFSGFLLLLIQIPVLIALYRIALNILTPEVMDDLYSFIPRPEVLDHTFLNLINLGERNTVIVILAAAAQYLQGKLLLGRQARGGGNSVAERMNRQMVFMGPILTLLVFFQVPAALGLYWLATTLFSIAQQVIINRSFHGEFGDIHQKNG